MSFLRFYDGAVPGKKWKTEETNRALKKKIESWKSEVVVNFVRNGERVENGWPWTVRMKLKVKMKGKASIAIGEICTEFSRSCKSNEGPVKFTCYWTSWPVKKFQVSLGLYSPFYFIVWLLYRMNFYIKLQSKLPMWSPVLKGHLFHVLA